jgi:hypothetical protein
MYQDSVKLQGQINALIKKYSDQKGKFSYSYSCKESSLQLSRARAYECKLQQSDETIRGDANGATANASAM